MRGYLNKLAALMTSAIAARDVSFGVRQGSACFPGPRRARHSTIVVLSS